MFLKINDAPKVEMKSPPPVHLRRSATCGSHHDVYTKQILWCGLTLSSAFSAALGQQYYDYTSPFNPAGEYHPLNKPTEARFLQFHLRVRHKRGKLLASGEVSDVQFYRFRNVIVTKKHLRFSTERRGGISYDFEGTFFRAGTSQRYYQPRSTSKRD